MSVNVVLNASRTLNEWCLYKKKTLYIVSWPQDSVNCPAVCFKDIHKRDLKLTGIEFGNWEHLADNYRWLESYCSRCIHEGQEKVKTTVGDQKTIQEANSANSDLHSTFQICLLHLQKTVPRIVLLRSSRYCLQKD